MARWREPFRKSKTCYECVSSKVEEVGHNTFLWLNSPKTTVITRVLERNYLIHYMEESLGCLYVGYKSETKEC